MSNSRATGSEDDAATEAPPVTHAPAVRSRWGVSVGKFLIVLFLIASAVEHQFERRGSDHALRPTNALDRIGEFLLSVAEWFGYYSAWITDIYYFFKEYLLNYLGSAGKLLVAIFGVGFSPLVGFANGIYDYCKEYATPTFISVVSIVLVVLFLLLVANCIFELDRRLRFDENRPKED